MRNKHLILEFTKQGLTRPQAIKRISQMRSVRAYTFKRVTNKQILRTFQRISPFLVMAKTTYQLTHAFQKGIESVTKMFNCIGDLAKEGLLQEALQIDKEMVNEKTT